LASSQAAAPPSASSGTPPSFDRLLDGFRHRVDGEIARFLGGKRGDGTSGEASAGAASASGLSDPSDLVDGVARLIAQGGKRLRPALVYYTYRACGGQREDRVLPLALATEFLHTYLLIHDDIMDHAETRRGQPSAHVHFDRLHRTAGLRGDSADFGTSVAILLGDLAHTYAVELFLAAATAPSMSSTSAAAGVGAETAPHGWGEINRCFSAMCEEVIGGQYLEILLAHRDPDPAAHAARSPDPAAHEARSPEPAGAGREAELLRVLRLKSGRYTAERPIQLGALLAGASAEVREDLSRYGTAVGEAFQLQDDLLGVFGDPATTGKPVGDDLREGKFTLLIHHALAAGSPADRQRIVAALGKPDLSAAEVAAVQQLLEKTGARRTVEAMIADRLDAARHALAALHARRAASGAGNGEPAARVGPLDHAGEPGVAGRGAEEQEGSFFLSGLVDYLREREQ
jgi:geranylgeranyl diphosphate synthase type I